MFRFCTLCLAAAAFLSLSSLRASAQATYAGDRDGVVQVGLTYSNSQTDEYWKRTTGITAYGAVDFKKHWGAEADIHLPGLISAPEGWSERSYEVGLRYMYRFRRYDAYAKGLAGIGQTAQVAPAYLIGQPATYFIYSGGGGLDIRLARSIIIRAVDFEYQRWPSFPQHALTPSIVSVGAAYRFR